MQQLVDNDDMLKLSPILEQRYSSGKSFADSKGG